MRLSQNIKVFTSQWEQFTHHFPSLFSIDAKQICRSIQRYLPFKSLANWFVFFENYWVDDLLLIYSVGSYVDPLKEAPVLMVMCFVDIAWDLMPSISSPRRWCLVSVINVIILCIFVTTRPQGHGENNCSFYSFLRSFRIHIDFRLG